MSEKAATTSGEVRKRYFEDVIEPEPEDVHERMKHSFDTGVTTGMYSSLEWGYSHLDEYKRMTLDALSEMRTKVKDNLEGGEESDSNET